MNSRVLGPGGGLLAALILAGCVEVPPAAVQQMIRAGWEHPQAYAGPDEVTIPLTRAPDHKLYFTLLVNGHPLPVAIDTGARTVFDRPTLWGLGLTGYRTNGDFWGFGGAVRVYAGYVNELDLGGLKIEGLSVIMLDLADLRRSQQEASLPAVSGLVGADLLAALGARIDFDHLTLTLRKPPAAAPAHADSSHP
ncbi:MAG TPA: retropepsin-like aspartic protease [Opitutaceae bacterium]|nr:retropepsin-like aspartic protease [Opitutaceae bacterium]